MFDVKSKTVRVGDISLSFETGRIARQANGAVVVRSGESIVFASACAASTPNEDRTFLPLRVDYQEKFSSAGKTLGGFVKREGRPSERETLVSRLIDRPIRPLFPEGYFCETQLLTYVWSYDKVNQTDILAITAASAALLISDIPFSKALAGVRVGYINDEFVINPSPSQMEKSELDLVLAGTEDALLMIEGYADFLPEAKVLEALETGHKAIKTICAALSEWAKEIGKEKHNDWIVKAPEELMGLVEKAAGPELVDALQIKDKQARGDAISLIKDRVQTELFPEGEEAKYHKADVSTTFKELQARIMRERILTQRERVDGRGLEDIRPISIQPGLLPRTHGSVLFTRGETQTLAVCTLGSENMAQRYETLDEDSLRRFYLQYFFPPFSVGEVGRSGPAGRREVGHGKLAERALTSTVPSKEEFPYVVRVESNITESNGSSSMASVCGGCIAMMDAGVPIKRPVAGIAMGLILEGENHAVLSDILGLEDALGDMDFKITGDQNGITAFQMDIKVEGITIDIMRQALAQAGRGITHILGIMKEACPTPRKEMSKYAPRIVTMKINPSKIGKLVGPGGKTIRAITADHGVEIDIAEDGTVSVSSNDANGVQAALDMIHGLTADIEVGQVYEGKVTGVVPFGLFVEVIPGQDGLCHISDIDHSRVENIEKLFKEGESIRVKVTDINERGQIKLSRKVLLPKE
ncbi:MAG: polyribonucleotide nucleotidyltransferase [Waddliaceae bacterium]|nr:polyribonucleotide nucleotidyltransferase [Waddliaceae bacterium]